MNPHLANPMANFEILCSLEEGIDCFSSEFNVIFLFKLFLGLL